MHVTKLVATLPGYATVARAAEVLHLAPRSVRDLIYSGRLPSLRIGRLHYVRASDLELERRRRLGLRLPPARQRTPRPRRSITPQAEAKRGAADPMTRRVRAAERAAIVSRWAERHHLDVPRVPFTPAVAESATTCAACGRALRLGARTLKANDGTQLCATCGRRALMDWADRRRLEAAAARRLALDFGSEAVPTQRIA